MQKWTSVVSFDSQWDKFKAVKKNLVPNNEIYDCNVLQYHNNVAISMWVINGLMHKVAIPADIQNCKLHILCNLSQQARKNL